MLPDLPSCAPRALLFALGLALPLLGPAPARPQAPTSGPGGDAVAMEVAEEAKTAPDEAATPGDAALEAREAEIEAARARERSVRRFEEVELRLGADHVDETDIRLLARIPLRRPGEVKAQRRMYAADSKLALARLADTRLTQRSDRCFPAVELEARVLEQALFEAYARRHAQLRTFTEQSRSSGLLSEIDAVRFDLASRVRMATREPAPLTGSAALEEPGLPLLVPPPAPLVLDEGTLREIIGRHHPDVARHRASAERYDAMAARERSRSRPWVKFVDLSYRHSTGGESRTGNPRPSADGGGGQLAFTVPFGGERANGERYDALERAARSDAIAVVDAQSLRARRALEALHAFEARSERLLELLEVADEAEQVGERWWKGRMARPGQVADLIDEAHDARRAVLEAREDAGLARCMLLAMTGVAAEDWPRGATEP